MRNKVVVLILISFLLSLSFMVHVVNSDGSDNDDGTYYNIPNPAGQIQGLGLSIKFSGDGNYMAIGHHGGGSSQDEGVRLHMYKLGPTNHTWYNITSHINLQPGTPPSSVGSPYGVTFIPAVGTPLYFACSSANSGSPYAYFYRVYTSNDTFWRLGSGSYNALPSNMCKDCAGSPNGSWVAFADQSSGCMLYHNVGGYFTGSYISSSGNAYAVRFNHNGTVLAVGYQNSPYLSIYRYNPGTGSWVLQSQPASKPSVRVYALEFTDDDEYLACTLEFSPYLAMYRIGATNHTYYKIANPTGTPTDECRAVAFSRNSTYMGLGSHMSPYFTLYRLGSYNQTWYRYPDLDTLPPYWTYAIAFSRNNTFLCVGYATASHTPPEMLMYKLNRTIPPSSPPPVIGFISIEGGGNGTQIVTFQPTFVWNRINMTIYYELEIANDSLFTTIYRDISSINEATYPSEYSETSSEVTFKLPTVYKLGIAKTYYCRVRAFIGVIY